MLNLIVDPKAGRGLAINNIKQVSKYLKKEKIPYLVYFVEKESDIPEFASSLVKSGETDFVFLSDDDCIHTFLNNVEEVSKINLGIIPSGTHNDFSLSLNLESHPIKAIKNILENKQEKVDYIKCNDIIVLNSIAFGAMESFENKLKTEKNKTKFSIFDKIKSYKSYEPIQLNFSGKEIRDKNVVVRECYICNGLYKDKIKVSPLSNPQDGLCNVVCLTQKETFSPIKDLISLKRGKHIYNEQNKVYWASQFDLTSSSVPIIAKIDGIIYTIETVSVTLVSEGLNIYVGN